MTSTSFRTTYIPRLTRSSYRKTPGPSLPTAVSSQALLQRLMAWPIPPTIQLLALPSPLKLPMASLVLSVRLLLYLPSPMVAQRLAQITSLLHPPRPALQTFPTANWCTSMFRPLTKQVKTCLLPPSPNPLVTSPETRTRPRSVPLLNPGTSFLITPRRTKAELKLGFIFPSIMFRKLPLAPRTFLPTVKCRIRPMFGTPRSIPITELPTIIGHRPRRRRATKLVIRTRSLKLTIPLWTARPNFSIMYIDTTTTVSLTVILVAVTRTVG